MKHLRIISGASLLAAALVSISVPPAFAQVTKSIGEGLDKAAAPSGYKAGITDLPLIIGRLISAALGLLGVVLLAYILYGGFLWMTAGGEEKPVKDARAIIKNAVIGLVIIVLAYSITSFILSQIGTAVGTSSDTPSGATLK